MLCLSSVQYFAEVQRASIVAAVLPWLAGGAAFGGSGTGGYESSITVVTSALVAAFLIAAMVRVGRWPSRGLGRGQAIGLLVSLVVATALVARRSVRSSSPVRSPAASSLAVDARLTRSYGEV